MNWAALFWFVMMVLLLIVEANTVAVISAWFAIGSLVAMLASVFAAPIWLQVLLFFAVSLVLLALLRPILRKYVNPKIEKTNVDSVIGTQGYVTARVDNLLGEGQVKLGGMYWTARSTDGTAIQEGTLVQVDRIEGVKAFVTPVKVKEEMK